MKYKNLLFDVDDTLLDFQAAENQALGSLFQTEGIPLTPEIKTSYQALNRMLWEEYEQGKRSRDEVVNQRFALLFQQFGKSVDGMMLEKQYRQFLNQGHQLLGNSRQIIADLSNKAELYVVTNGVSDTQYQRLTASKLLPYFKNVFVSEDTGYQKPMKEYFDYVFDRIPDFKKEETVIIGDSLSSDIAGGKQAGIDTIWLNSDENVKTTIAPTYRISSLDEIYTILAN